MAAFTKWKWNCLQDKQSKVVIRATAPTECPVHPGETGQVAESLLSSDGYAILDEVDGTEYRIRVKGGKVVTEAP